MIIPETFELLGETFSVGLHTNPVNEKMHLVNGIIYYDSCRIRLRDNVPHSEVQEVAFLHEVIHAVLKKTADHRFDDEALVDRLSRGLHQVFKTSQGDVRAQPKITVTSSDS